MMRQLSVVLALALVGPGCAYIGQAAFEEKRDSLDHDGDKAPFGGANKDCDDFNEKVSPNNDEIPYDGLDNDCAGGDVVDADGDGFPGILKSDYEAQYPDAEWPTDVQPEPLDCADDPSIWPNAKDIYPNQGNDPVYDGIDSDCAGDNDFDADGDGYMPDEYQDAFEQYVLDWGYEQLSASAAFGDCNDLRPAANPGVAPADDAWYDGHDDDCAGNNDFDADGDGFMWDEATNAVAYGDFLDTYHPGGAPWAEQWEDCLDQPDPSRIVQADPSQVFPGNPSDIPYDGIDSDCLCDNDFDADLDTVMPDEASDGSFGSTFDDYEADWACGLTASYGDCDDSDPDTSPGSLEVLGDAADSDCDGDPDATPFGFGNSLWENPRPPRLAKTNNHYVLVTSASYCDPAGTAPAIAKDWVGVALPFEHTVGYDAQVSGAEMIWTGAATPLPLGLQVDTQGFGEDVLIGTGWVFPGQSGYITSKTLNYLPTSNAYVAAATEWHLVQREYESTAVDITVDSAGHPWLLGCGVDTLQVIRGDANGLTTTVPGAGIYPDISNPTGIPAGVCFWAEDPIPSYTYPTGFGGTGKLVACEPGVDCETYDFDADAETLTVSATNDWAGEQLEYGQYREGWHILINTGLGGIELDGADGNVTLLPGWTVHDGDGHWRDTTGGPEMDEVFVAAVAEPIPDDGLGKRVVLSYGPIGGPYVEKVLPFEHPTRPDLEPDGVGIYVDNDRLFIGVSAKALPGTIDPNDCYPYGTYPATHDYCLSDVVGWVFFGW